MCNIEEEIEKFLSKEHLLKIHVPLEFEDKELESTLIKLEPPKKKNSTADAEFEVVKVYRKKTKKDGKGLF